MYQQPKAHIRTFSKRWSFIWRCFFPVNILKYVYLTKEERKLLKYKKSLMKECKTPCEKKNKLNSFYIYRVFRFTKDRKKYVNNNI